MRETLKLCSNRLSESEISNNRSTQRGDKN